MKRQAIYEVDDCGCNGPKLILQEGWDLVTISEGLKYHIHNMLCLTTVENQLLYYAY